MISATVRFRDTRASLTVTGVSVPFAWLGLVANALWLGYGLDQGVPSQIVVSIVWGTVFTYIIWRLSNRVFTATQIGLVVLAVTAGLALAFGLDGNVAGWIGGTLILSSTAPQVVKIWRTRDLAGTAPRAWAISAVIGMLWTAYGLVAELPPVFVLNAIYVGMVVTLLIGVTRARRTSPVLSTA